MKLVKAMEVYISTMDNGEHVITMESDSRKNYFVYIEEENHWASVKMQDGKVCSVADYVTAKDALPDVLEAAIRHIEEDENVRGEIVMTLYELGMIICVIDYLNKIALPERSIENVRKALRTAHQTDPIMIIRGMQRMAGVEYEFIQEGKLTHESYIIGGCS